MLFGIPGFVANGVYAIFMFETGHMFWSGFSTASALACLALGIATKVIDSK